MLNTDLHNPSQKNKMSKEAFVQRTRSAAADAKLVRGLLTRPIARHAGTPPYARSDAEAVRDALVGLGVAVFLADDLGAFPSPGDEGGD